MFGAAMATMGPGAVLLGRRSEIEALDRLLAGARGGRSGVLVLSGEPGIGKTALLEYAVGAARGFQVVRTVGVESEMELPFAALQHLCAPMLAGLKRLPGPQRDALGVAFGLSRGDQPDRYLVGLAGLSLLSDAAEERPLVCVVDDAQWLDRASVQAIAFVARRLLADRVAFVFAAREPGEELTGLPRLPVQGLRNNDAQALLRSVVHTSLDERVRQRFISETRGNPLALLELPRAFTASELAGGFGVPPGLPLSGRIEESYLRRLAELSGDVRLLLLVAAAEPVGDPAVLWRAAERLGIGTSAADAAEAAGLLEIRATVIFRHPLVRSAVYRAASPDQRREVHLALAAAIDSEIDPDRRAWHRGQATSGPDEAVARELARSADRAQERGGLAAAAAFREKAAALTLDPAQRARRALAAAQASYQAGAPDPALRMVATAESGPLDDLERAQTDLLRAQIRFASDHSGDASLPLLNSARRFESLDVKVARETYLEALGAAVFAGSLAGGTRVLEVANAARAASPSPSPPRALDLLLDGLALLISEGHSAGSPTLRRAVTAFRSEDIAPAEGLRWLWLAARAAALLWDYESWDALSYRLVTLARDAGALTVLFFALATRVGVHLLAGELGTAASLVDEVEAVNESTRSGMRPYGSLGLAAFRGREAEASELIAAATRDLTLRPAAAKWSNAVLQNGLGRYEDAVVAAREAAEDPSEFWFATWGLVELIEASARTGAPELAATALDRLLETTRVCATDWALGVAARSRALLNEGEAAEGLYAEAIDRLGRTRVRVDLARARLLYGEWLRRERRRLDARRQLREAHDLFVEFGMEAFAERARIELEATGERARKRTAETRDDLTPQEAQIARLAAEGETNQEIAARLFISPSTVDYHLRKAFRKLGVRSRTQLALVLARDEGRRRTGASTLT
jgi:DNA-binding CsgD family transcriptional regulator